VEGWAENGSGGNLAGPWAPFGLGQNGPLRPFFSFLIFFSFSFLFSFDFWFEKLLQNLCFEFGQLLNSCESFPLLSKYKEGFWFKNKAKF
jgi:hypothetical protein